MLLWLPGVVVWALVASLMFTTSASAECAWVFWMYEDMAYSFPHAPMERIDAFDTRARCVEEINKFEARHKGAYRVDRLNETLLFMASGPIGENRVEIQVRCLPDTVDPRGKEAKP